MKLLLWLLFLLQIILINDPMDYWLIKQFITGILILNSKYLPMKHRVARQKQL